MSARVTPSSGGKTSVMDSIRKQHNDQVAVRAMTMSADDVSNRASAGVITLYIRRAEFTDTKSLIDRMDPYVEVSPSWSHSISKTLPDQDGHKTPSWKTQKHNSMFKIKFPGAMFDSKLKFRFQIFDKNRFSKDTLMGEGEFNVMPIIRSSIGGPTTKPTEHTITLTKTKPYNQVKSPKNRDTKPMTPIVTDSAEPSKLKKVTGKLWIEFHFQPHLPGSGSEEIARTQSGGRGGLGALLGVVAETLHTMELDSNIRATHFVILPSSPFRRYWDFITMLGLTYTAIFTPVQISFLGDIMTIRNIPDWWFVFCIDRSIDLIFLSDIVVNFRSAWETDEGVETFHWREAAWRYLTTWFLLDLVSAMPLDFLDLLVVAEPGSDGTAVASQLRSLKLVRLFRLIKIAKVIRASRIFKRFEQQMTIKYGVLRLFKFLGMIMIIAHWNACGFYLVSSLSEGAAAQTWATSAGIEWGERENPGEKYTTSLYWAMMTLTTIGYGDVVATNIYERIYVILMMMISALVFAFVVGTMCSLIQGLNSQTLYFQSMIDDINDYMEMTHLPLNLRRRIRRYCLFRRDGALHQNEGAIWAFLSPSLRLEAALHQYLPILEQVPYFRETSSHFVSELACHLHQLVYGPNEVLVAQGTKERIMFILNKGRVHVEKDTKDQGVKILASLSDGSYFGEQALLFGTFRNATVRSLSFCNVCVLKKVDVDGVLDKYPADRIMLKKLLIRRMWKTTFLNPEFRAALADHSKKKAKLIAKLKNTTVVPTTPTVITPKKRKKKKKKDKNERKQELSVVTGSETKSNDTKYYSQSMSSPTIPSPPTSSASLLSIVKIDGKLDSIQQQQIEMMSAVTELTSKMSLLMDIMLQQQKQQKLMNLDKKNGNEKQREEHSSSSSKNVLNSQLLPPTDSNSTSFSSSHELKDPLMRELKTTEKNEDENDLLLESAKIQEAQEADDFSESVY